MARPDLTIRGGGIFGLACGYEAARRGAKVRLIEAHYIGAGSSGGLVGALAPHVPENWNPKKQFQLESLLMAARFWADVQDHSGIDPGYARLGRVQPLAKDDTAISRAKARSVEAKALWCAEAQWIVRPATGADWEPRSPSGLLIEDSLSARLHPRLAARALVAAIQSLGGEVIFGGGEDAGPVLWATGYSGLQELNHALGRKVGGGVKGQALLLDHDARDLPQLYADSLHIVPHVDGTTAVGSTSENQWDDPHGIDRQADALLARVAEYFPILANARVIERWAGIRPRAKSRAPMLGAWPSRSGHFIANGGFKIGFGMAPKVAQVMIDLILDGRDAIPAGFRVEDNF